MHATLSGEEPGTKPKNIYYSVLYTGYNLRNKAHIGDQLTPSYTLVHPLLYTYITIILLNIVVQNLAQPVLLCDLQNTSQATTTRYRKPERESRFQTSHFRPKPVINSGPRCSWEIKR